MLKDQEEIQNTIVIAQFMGYEIGDYLGQGKPIYNKHKSLKTFGDFKELWGGLEVQFLGRFTEYVKYPFHEDWNYLMPIVSLCKEKQIFGSQNLINDIDEGLLNIDIENTYKSVIKFINFYNQN
jgi:hypothetical protein